MQLKSTEKVDTNRYTLNIIIDAETFGEANNKAFRKGASHINVPGFRKGHAPRRIIEKMFGEDVFYEDAFNSLYSQTVDQAIEQSGLDLADDNIDFKLNTIGQEGVDFVVTVTVQPEVTLGNYKGLAVQRPVVQATDEEIDAELKRQQERASRMVTVTDRPAQMGDTAVIDFEGFIDGEAFEGGKGESFPLELGSNQFIPGFEEQIVGHTTEDAFDVEVNFPEDYHAEELKGKPTVFKVTLHEIKHSDLPELDDEFAKDVSEYDTLEELKKSISDNILDSKTQSADSTVESRLLEELLKSFEAEIPESMIDARAKESRNNFEYRLRSQGLDFKTYLQYTGMSEEDFDARFRQEGEGQVKVRLALEKVAAEQNLKATEEEIDEQYQKLQKEYSVEMEKLKAVIPVKEVRKDIAVGKAMDFLKENAVITDESEEPTDDKAEETDKSAE